MRQIFFQQQTPSMVLVCNSPDGFHLTFYIQDTFLAQSYQWSPEDKTSSFSLPSTAHRQGSWVWINTWRPEEHLTGCSRHSISSCFLTRSRDFRPAFWFLHLPMTLQSFRKRLKVEESQKSILSIPNFDSVVSKVRHLTPTGWLEGVEISTWSIS